MDECCFHPIATDFLCVMQGLVSTNCKTSRGIYECVKGIEPILKHLVSTTDNYYPMAEIFTLLIMMRLQN